MPGGGSGRDGEETEMAVMLPERATEEVTKLG